MWLSACLIFGLISRSSADIYLHSPRGSNNRMNEATSTRANANRLFDSQNNNKGGYNVGDTGDTPAGNDASKQYHMKYFQSGESASTELVIEWTMQHGCGGGTDVKTPTGRKQRPELECDVIIQYLCQEDKEPTDEQSKQDEIRNGVSTVINEHHRLPGQLGQLGPTETYSEAKKRKAGDVKLTGGLHENWDWYDKCSLVKRNRGIFKGNQNFEGRTARYTRQNPDGIQYGFECPAERDYYPYWDPTPWKDIAILTTHNRLCRRVSSQSFNVKPVSECVEFYSDSNIRKHWSNHNNHPDCVKNGGNWTELHNYLEKLPEHKSKSSCTRSRGPHDPLKRIWAIPYDSITLKPECLVALPAPVCHRAPWTRANHLGSTLDADPTTFKWKLPYFPSRKPQRCVLRIRYNITSNEIDPNLNATYNKIPPVTEDPSVHPILGVDQSLTLQMNVQQYGRTFQDRSHVFLLVPRPPNIKSHTIHNLNVKGKRGNIVQTFPAVEYDFVPQHVFMKAADLLHIQWTGSNTHLNQPEGADGAGKAGTDRTNIVEIAELGYNYPTPWKKTTLFKKAKIKWIYFNYTTISPESLALNLMSSGFYKCINRTECPGDRVDKESIYETNPGKLNELLNNAPASYEGVVIGLPTGVYHIMSTRANNFSNRSHKRTINVCPYSCEFSRSPDTYAYEG